MHKGAKLIREAFDGSWPKILMLACSASHIASKHDYLDVTVVLNK